MEESIIEYKYLGDLDIFQFRVFSINKLQSVEWMMSLKEFDDMINTLHTRRADYLAIQNKNKEESKAKTEKIDKFFTNIDKLTDQVMALTQTIANLEPRITQIEKLTGVKKYNE